MTLLSVEALDVRYGRTHAVMGVSLRVDAGEIVTVLGANGAGKSSLLKGLIGTAPASSGKVMFDGQEITRLAAPARVSRGLVLVPEGRQILVSLTIHENLLMGGYIRRDAGLAKDIDAVYQRFPNLAARRDMLASVLSGGEQQMLAIGRALVARPKLMMLDEPSLGLSPLLVERLFGLVREVNREGIAILLVEQNTQMALETATRGTVMELGRAVLEGKAADLAQDEALAAAYLGARH